jgi:protein AroM
MPRSVGFVTIGQSPRADMMEEFERALPGARLVQAGALDELTPAEIADLAPAERDHVLVSRLRSGRQVRLAHRHIEPRVQACLDRFARDGVDLAVLLCTGEFAELRFAGVLLRPHRVLPHVVAAVAEGLPAVRLGVMVPDAAQTASADARWGGRAAAVTAVAASPYGDPEAVGEAGRTLRRAGASLVVMDCIGYTRSMQQAVVWTSGVPAVFATGAVALVVRELVQDGVPAPSGGR